MPASQNRKKKRKTEHIEEATERIYIFCEGEQTEPLYFKGFEKRRHFSCDCNKCYFSRFVIRSWNDFV